MRAKLLFAWRWRELTPLFGFSSSGKSALSLAIQGELQCIKGTLITLGQVSCLSQVPWIFAGSIEDNITFGMEFDQTRFDEVIYYSCLLPEVSALPRGVKTIIGDAGFNLSSGLRSRIKFVSPHSSSSFFFLS